MNYLMKKPMPPTGHRMLEEGKDISSVQDFIWMIDDRTNKDYQHPTQRWGYSIMQTSEGLKIASDVNMPYVEPKNIEDYCFFRCRKI